LRLVNAVKLCGLRHPRGPAARHIGGEKMTQDLQGSLFNDGINGEQHTLVDGISSPFVKAGTESSTVPANKPEDKALFYDYLIHGPIEIGETLILYADGTFEKEGKNVRK